MAQPTQRLVPSTLLMKSKLTPPRIQIQSTESSSHLDSSPKPDGAWYQLSPGQCCKSVEGIKIGMFARLARPVGVELQLQPRASQPDLAHPLHSNQPQLFPNLINVTNCAAIIALPPLPLSDRQQGQASPPAFCCRQRW